MNVISIAGQLGKDAELRATPKGDQVLSFSVADSQGKDKPTIWWNCQLWGKRAEVLGQYLLKGQAVTVSGSVSQRQYTDKEGNERTSMDIRVNDVALQGGRKEHQAEQEAKPKSQYGTSRTQADFPDEEIPF